MRIHPDPHSEGIGNVIAYAATGAILPTVRGARLRPKSGEEGRCGAPQARPANSLNSLKAFPSWGPTTSLMLASTSEQDAFR